MKTHLITLTMLNIIIGITIAGCGGEGEKDSSPKQTVEATQPTEDLAQEIITTSDLMSVPDFDFISSADLDVTLPASPSTTVGYFINICTNFAKENDEVKINYNSCKLRTTLTTFEQPFTLSLSNTELVLVAQIWPIEAGAQAVTIYWNIAESGNNWKIAI